MDLDYLKVVADLKEHFPQGTVKFSLDTNRPYIPNQVYTDRLERVTNSRWSLEIKELDVNAPFRYVKAIVRVHIDAHFRDGYGFSTIDGDPSLVPNKITSAVDHAVNEAFITAIDSYQMGWKDLAPYKLKDWGGNPALQHLLEGEPPPMIGTEALSSSSKSPRQCMKCKKYLSDSEINLLKQLPKLSLIYCFEHLPNHWKRELPEKVLTDFEATLD